MGLNFLQSHDIGEFLLHREDLNFLIKCHSIDTLNANALLVIKLVLEVLNVKVLQLSRHRLDFFEQLVVILISQDITSLDHVMHIEFINFFEGQGHNLD